jgi:hypothetical protein
MQAARGSCCWHSFCEQLVDLWPGQQQHSLHDRACNVVGKPAPHIIRLTGSWVLQPVRLWHTATAVGAISAALPHLDTAARHMLTACAASCRCPLILKVNSTIFTTLLQGFMHFVSAGPSRVDVEALNDHMRPAGALRLRHAQV